MPEPGQPIVSPSVSDRLHEISRLLRQADHLSPEARRALADLSDELGRALGPNVASSAETKQLADSAAHLIEALHRKEASGTLAAARDRLEQAVLATEAQLPNLAGIAHRLLDALGNLGI